MKLIKYTGWLLGGISLIVLIVFLFDTKSLDMVGMYLSWSYILLGIAALAAIGLPLIYMLQNPKMLKKTLLSVGILVAVGVIAYLLASSTMPYMPTMETQPTPTAVKWTDTGLIAMYFFLIGAVLAILAGGLVNMIRNR